jgi:hypothetical protein
VFGGYEKMRPSILITAYKHPDLVENNIRRIRDTYTLLNNCPIVVVTTSEEDVGFYNMVKKYKDVHLIEFKDAPPYEPIWYGTSDQIAGWNYGISLSKRIFLSIEKGLNLIDELNSDVCLHLHSDSFWETGKEKILYNLMKEVYDKKLLFSGDLCIDDLNSSITKNTLFQPEGLIINVETAKKYNFNRLSRIWEGDFNSNNWGSIEMLIGQFAEFCLSGILICDKNTKHSEIYEEKVKIRLTRTYHGFFENGLVNINIKQR